MPRVSAAGALGLVAASGLDAQRCVLVSASSAGHARLRVRMKRADHRLELARLADDTAEAERPYELLVSTGRGSEALRLDAEEELTLRIPAGRRELREVVFVVRRVRAVVAGLRGSEFIHRALVSVTERDP